MVCVLKVLNWPYNFLVDVHTLNHLFVPEIKDQIVLVLINNCRYYSKKESALNKKCLQSYRKRPEQIIENRKKNKQTNKQTEMAVKSVFASNKNMLLTACSFTFNA